MDKNSIRNKLQQAVVDISLTHNKILLTWATGVGKSLAALKTIEKKFQDNDDIFGYLICKEHSHLDNWKKEIDDHKMNFFNSCTERFLYASLHKYTNKPKVDFVILDEVHAITEKRLEHLKQIVDNKTLVIALSATVEDEKMELLKQLGTFKVLHIGINKAIEYGILPHPKVIVHKFKLDDVRKDYSFTITKGIASRRIEKNCDYDEKDKILLSTPHLKLNVVCTEKQYYHHYNVIITQRRNMYFGALEEQSKNAKYLKNTWLQLTSQRKSLIANIKTKYAKQIIDDSFKGFRYICFTHTKKQAESINSKNYVHSDLHKDEVIKRKNNFNNGKINELVVVNMFKEAINLVNIEKGLIVQLDNVKLSFIQMLGRVFRSEFPEMHILILKDTQDEAYLETVLEGFDENYLTIINH